MGDRAPVEVSGEDFGPLPERLPLLPIRDLVVFPYMVVPLFVSREVSIGAIEEAQAADGLMFLAAQKMTSKDAPYADDVYDVGTVGKVLRVKRLADGQIKLLVQGLRRARIDDWIQERPTMAVRASALEDAVLEDQQFEVEALIREVHDSLKALNDAGRGLPKDVVNVMLGLTEPGALADLVASNLGLKVADAQQVLSAGPPLERLKHVNEALAKELEVLTWQQKIQSQAKEEMSRAQREYFLREQLKQIQNELGDLDSKDEDLRSLRSRLDEAGLSPDAQAEANKQLRRLESMNADSAESSVVRTYLEWLADLPWSAAAPDAVDLKAALATLDADHHGLEAVKDRILEYMAVLGLKGDMKGPILCFVGPPGVGKTSLGRSIARALSRPFVRVSLGGVHDESEIRGHRRTYVGAMPGRIIGGLKQAGANNPVFMLDELDKVGTDARGDPASALLEVLDPEQNDAFTDHYLNLPFDLSRVLWLGTANVVDRIPAPLRDRMEIIQLPGYDAEDKLHIAEQYLVPKQLERAGLSSEQLHISKAALEAIIDRYTREAGLRSLERQLAKIARKVARSVAEGRTRPARVTTQKLEKYLGPRRHDPERPDHEDRVGLATGLAWTEAGGSILHVEATIMRGKPGLTLTGQLGAVMKESAQAALSCARSRMAMYGIDEDVLSNQELHVHVPHGAIPKDGPSAGITMAVSILSLLMGRPIRRDVAMTGEITLRGRVLPVGGLRQKLLAAARAGVNEVIVPAANEPDLKEIPSRLLSRVKVHPVKELEEVLEIAVLGFSPPKRSESERGARVGWA